MQVANFRCKDGGELAISGRDIGWLFVYYLFQSETNHLRFAARMKARSIPMRTSRFEAAIGRGLSAFVGRERELEVLERALGDARNELRAADLVAEPGMGKIAPPLRVSAARKLFA
jgi:hypothetical protein